MLKKYHNIGCYLLAITSKKYFLGIGNHIDENFWEKLHNNSMRWSRDI